jgi:hypothetical protein
VDEDVLVAAIGLHEPVALGVIEPLDNTGNHFRAPPGVAGLALVVVVVVVVDV